MRKITFVLMALLLVSIFATKRAWNTLSECAPSINTQFCNSEWGAGIYWGHFPNTTEDLYENGVSVNDHGFGISVHYYYNFTYWDAGTPVGTGVSKPYETWQTNLEFSWDTGEWHKVTFSPISFWGNEPVLGLK